MNKIKTQILFCLLLVSMTTFGQNYKILRSLTSAGGTTAVSPSYSMMNTTGQADVSTAVSASYQMQTGFWDFYASQQEQAQSFSFSVAGGWNMISIPLTVLDYRKIPLYSTAT
ncbi:MAG: hypothetical protein HYZ34_02785, partial [Ignavibacteriae bacterium]|nr:hypothetical protein [Ignavibacteriota bacterium]